MKKNLQNSLKRVIQPLSIGLLIAMFLLPNLAIAQDYLIIKNADNLIDAESEDEKKNIIKPLYLKLRSNWPNNVEAEPFAPEVESEAHKQFVNNVLGMTAKEVDTHWARLKQTIGAVPPRGISSESIALRQVKRKEGAFAVVPAGTELPAGVDIFLTF